LTSQRTARNLIRATRSAREKEDRAPKRIPIPFEREVWGGETSSREGRIVRDGREGKEREDTLKSIS